MGTTRALCLAAVWVGLASFAGAPADAARPGARPVPAWDGYTLDGKPLSTGDLIGKRTLLAFLDPRSEDAAPLGQSLAAIQGERADHNFEIVGVLAAGSGADGTRMVSELGLAFPVVRDQPGGLGSLLRIAAPAAAVVVDAEGYVVAGQNLGVRGEEGRVLVEDLLRDWLRLPKEPRAGTPALGDLPQAPDFEATPLEGGAPVTRASLEGQAFVLVFFLHTCPHCHRALESLGKSIAALPEEQRLPLYGVSSVARTAEVRDRLAQEELDFFPVLLDPKGEMREAYGATMGVPVVFLIDAEGRIRWRTDGWRDDRDAALARMRLAILAGQKPPMLLHATGYSGDEFCATCHESEQATWELTAHAGAFDTLVRHGADSNAECVGCHVVGFGEKRGYDLARPDAQLEGVGCETCHGRGGPHLSPGHLTNDSYEQICSGCHDQKHSLGFDYATFLPKVSHAANAHLMLLPAEEKQKLLEGRRAIRAPLLPTKAAYVGSVTCRECHPGEHETWAAQPHARAFATLETAGSAEEGDCRSCHTTGYDRGGFPTGGVVDEHADLAGVGCESCHGPAGDHVAPDAARRGTILSLGDKCDSCVILQICGSCHDDANDPGFEFEVQQKIDLQRHGTIEAGTGKPLRGATTR